MLKAESDTVQLKTTAFSVMGETFVDFFGDAIGALEGSKTLTMHLGGAPTNVATHLAKLGRKVELLTRVGVDAFGRFALARLEEQGVALFPQAAQADHETGLCFVTRTSDGQRHFLHRGGEPFAGLNHDDLDWIGARPLRPLIFSASSLRHGESVEYLRELLAARAGWSAVDPGSVPRHWGPHKALVTRLKSIAPHLDLLKVSRDELAYLTGRDKDEEGLEALHDWGPRLVVITLGAEGALWKTCDGQGRVAAPQVYCVDSTGAGDAFMAALMHAIGDYDPSSGAWGKALERGLRDANAYASEVVTRIGASAF